jgi:hypothetical protein
VTKVVDFLTPARRRAIYAAGAALFGVLVALGVIDATTSGEWLAILDKVLGFASLLLAVLNTKVEPKADDAA